MSPHCKLSALLSMSQSSRKEDRPSFTSSWFHRATKTQADTVGAATAEKLEGISRGVDADPRGVDADPHRFPSPFLPRLALLLLPCFTHSLPCSSFLLTLNLARTSGETLLASHCALEHSNSGKKSFNSILATESIFSIRFGNLINLPLVH